MKEPKEADAVLETIVSYEETHLLAFRYDAPFAQVNVVELVQAFELGMKLFDLIHVSLQAFVIDHFFLVDHRGVSLLIE